jgi:hypothetical protein
VTARAILVGFVCVACGGGKAVHYPMPETRLAKAKPETSAAATECRERRSYDPERGCVLPLWGVPVTLEHENKLTPAFTLVGAAFALDGELMFDSNDAKLFRRGSFPVFRTNVRRGEHELRVLLRYRGHGYGVFSYLTGYRFESTTSHSFRAEARDIRLRSIGFEKTEVPLEERPAIRIQSW